jgi:hypothetical protein
MKLQEVFNKYDILDPSTYQVLILPEEDNDLEGNVIDSYDSADFTKYLKSNGISCANSYHLDISAKVIERRSNEVWLGQVVIVDNVILPLVLSLLANYITNKTKLGAKKLVVQKDVNLELKMHRNGEINSISYRGDGETIVEILNSLTRDKNG